MKTVAVVPMKLNNRRLPQKNTKPFTNGKPLCWYILSTLLQVRGVEEVYVYCSNPEMNEVLQRFAADVPADVYVMTHTTAPFVKRESIEKGLDAVLSGEYDSAFAVKELRDFLWKDGKPFNYQLDAIPRTQDLPPLYEETSGFYIYKAEVMTELGRRIGDRPKLITVSEVESCDIDEAEDFYIAATTASLALRTPSSSSTACSGPGWTSSSAASSPKRWRTSRA